MQSIVLVTLIAALGASAANARPFKSVDAAYNFVLALDRSGLDTIAAAVPNEPGTFVAVLYVAGRKLLVVSARHPSPERIAGLIAKRQYPDVYAELLGTTTPQDKFYLQDANADGILSALRKSVDVDILQEHGVRQTRFDGDFAAQGLTPAVYDARLAAADARYAHLLAVLRDALPLGHR